MNYISEARLRIPVPRQDSIKEILSGLRSTPRPETQESVKPAQGSLQLPKLKTQIVGIGGKPKSGKDLLIDFLQEKYSGVDRATFSDHARVEINACLIDREINHQITLENKSFYRPLLQEWCAGRREEYGPTYLNQFMAEEIDEKASGSGLLMITGLRDPAEFELIVEKGGELWRVIRPGNPFRSDHVVETAADDIVVDREVINPDEGNTEPFRENSFAAFREICD